MNLLHGVVFCQGGSTKHFTDSCAGTALLMKGISVQMV